MAAAQVPADATIAAAKAAAQPTCGSIPVFGFSSRAAAEEPVPLRESTHRGTPIFVLRPTAMPKEATEVECAQTTADPAPPEIMRPQVAAAAVAALRPPEETAATVGAATAVRAGPVARGYGTLAATAVATVAAVVMPAVAVAAAASTAAVAAAAPL
jgi:hypothetical protein